jgi:hypothetical protein
MNRRYVLTAFTLLVLAALACNRTIATPAPSVEAPPPTDTVAGATDQPPIATTPAPSPGDATATPTAGTPACVYDADFVEDVTIPDDTELSPGADFVKTWRMRNNGACAWDTGTAWVFESGDKMGGPDSVSVPVTEPGETTDISVHLTAPTTPGAYISRWRMRGPDGESFGTLTYVQIIVPAAAGPTATPTLTPTPTPTSAPGVGPTINYFRADVQEADPGDTVKLEWDAVKASSATLYHLMPTGQLGNYWTVDPTDSFEYAIAAAERNHTDFLLIVSDDEGHSAQKSLSITLRCPDTWFFSPAPDECPASPALISDGAEQPFERGAMVWVRAQDLIYVLYADGASPKWSVFSDEWDEGDPVDDPVLTPPAGVFQPVRGFGLVWREQASVRDRLGWALAPEAAFGTAVQRTSRPKYNDTYIKALDGKVWKLLPEGSGWEKLP